MKSNYNQNFTNNKFHPRSYYAKSPWFGDIFLKYTNIEHIYFKPPVKLNWKHLVNFIMFKKTNKSLPIIIALHHTTIRQLFLG